MPYVLTVYTESLEMLVTKFLEPLIMILYRMDGSYATIRDVRQKFNKYRCFSSF